MGNCASEAAFEAVEIEKPSTDYREYKSVRLANNLQVMLVSDPKCDRAAAAMSVGVGSIFDPEEIPGLAHFCEHMLFLGTAKYPQEDAYNEYLAKNGGMSNAYTAETVTNYFFSVKPEALGGALDRFAQFFISPLFTETATERELQAVDSEHSKNLQQDSWRGSQLLRNAMNPAHPLHHFMTGNSETLREAPSRKGIDVRAALLDFHARYYSANVMRLVIVGREPPEGLLAMAEERFSAIGDRGVTVPKDSEIGGDVEALPPERLGRLVHLVPVNDVRSATFQFGLPGQRQHWRSKPSHYLSHLIGHEGRGSLLTALKRRGLATELMAGSSLEEAGVHILSITVMLTEAGEQDIAAVGDLVFAYIRLLREAGPDERLWHELQKLSNLGFRFRSMADAMSTASGLAHSLQEHSPDVALSAGARLWDYEPHLIAELLGLLTCDRLILGLASKAHSGRCNLKEEWYGTKYSDEPLDPELKARWEAATADPDLHLPEPNPFIPDDLELRPPEAEQQPAAPQPLALGPDAAAVATAYFRKDEAFGLPKAVCGFNIYCPYAAESVVHRMRAELWCLAVAEELNEFAYEAQMAGLSYSLQAAPSGMQLNVAGYNDKLPKLVEAVAKKMAGLTEVSEQAYGIVREVLERNLSNAARRSQPYQQCSAWEGLLISRPAYSFEDRLAALRSEACSRAALTGVNRQLLDRCHVESLLQGNLTAEEARGLVQSLLEPIGCVSPLATLPTTAVARLPPGWTALQREGTNPEERNGAVVVRLQAAEYSLQNHCLVALVAQILSQRFFDELRTKQQLGYIVNAAPCLERHGFVGLRFVVQSEHPPVDVFQRVRLWGDGAWDFLEKELSDATFEEYRSALVSQLRERPKSLGEEFSRHWAELAFRSFAFGNREALAAHLETLALEDLRAFTSRSLRGAAACCVLVASQEQQQLAGAAPPPALAGCDRTWTPEDVAEFRQGATWRFRNAAIDRGAADAGQAAPSPRL